jgi:Na+/H+-translocating membrane pyrophosphatase
MDMSEAESANQEPFQLARINQRAARENLARNFSIAFFVVAVAAWITGAVGAQSEIDNNWKLTGFTDSSINADFQTANEKSSCSGGTVGGCARIQVVSKYDCSSVNGVANGDDDKGNAVETINTSEKNVTRGQSFVMEFDLNSIKSTHWNLTQLECVRA